MWWTLVGLLFFLCFFFQAEDGIRDYDVTGVQTCALPIFHIDENVLVAWVLLAVVGTDWCLRHCLRALLHRCCAACLAGSRWGSRNSAGIAATIRRLPPELDIRKAVVAADAPSRKPREAVSMGLYHGSLILAVAMSHARIERVHRTLKSLGSG